MVTFRLRTSRRTAGTRSEEPDASRDSSASQQPIAAPTARELAPAPASQSICCGYRLEAAARRVGVSSRFERERRHR